MRTTRLALLCVLTAGAGVLLWRTVGSFSKPQGRGPQLGQATAAISARAQDSMQPGPQARAAEGDESQERLGPFSIAEKDYSVVLRKKKRQPGQTQEVGETVVSMEIQDGSGAIEYRRTFPYQSQNEEFSDAWFVSAGILAGTNGSGLLVNYAEDSEPSDPEPEPTEFWQVFGVLNGKLQPFSGPIAVQGGLLSSEKLKTGYKTAGPLDSQSDRLDVRVWAHHFRLIYPPQNCFRSIR